MKGRVGRVAFVALILIAALSFAFIPRVTTTLSILPCKFFGSEAAKDECVFKVVEWQLTEHGISAAIDTLDTARALMPEALDTGCHLGMHRIGDMTYFDYSGVDLDIAALEYPKTTMSCGRGFYHGLFEHLFQDRPDPEFITKTCTYFRTRPEKFLSDEISVTCFHAAGHGLFRAHSEMVPKDAYGTAEAFLNAPIATCDVLQNVTDEERFYCKTGVESIFIQSTKAYGFAQYMKKTFTICDIMPSSLHPSCYNVRALMSTEINAGYDEMLRHCDSAPDTLYAECIEGGVDGLFVNGKNPQAIDAAFRMCEDSRIRARGFTDPCYQRLAAQISDFYKVDSPLCARVPEVYRAYCYRSRL